MLLNDVPTHCDKTAVVLRLLMQFETPIKDDISKLAELKQQDHKSIRTLFP